MHIRTCAHTHTCMNTHGTCAHTHTCMNTYMYAHVHAYTCTHVHTPMHVRIYIQTHICICNNVPLTRGCGCTSRVELL